MARAARLRTVLRVLALVPIITGTLSAVLGSAIVPGAGTTSAGVESELRFYAVWWAGLGLFLWWVADRVEERGRELRVACALLFAGGLARLWAIADAGRPPQTFVVLMAIELALPLVLVPWQARVRRAATAAAADRTPGTGAPCRGTR